MQLLAPHFREDALFRATHAYQQVTGWHKSYPKGFDS
jgi:Asp-tRNA(Asn)/Glu-tRNA(Gln) amidotransferase A subunit family amidase